MLSIDCACSILGSVKLLNKRDQPMFTLEKATQIFPDTLSADVVPAITARFRLLSAEDQLALIWYAYV